MRVERHQNPAAVRTVVGPQLHGDLARHNLMLGLLDTLIDRPHVYPRFHLWSVQDGDRVVGAALRTEPHNVVLAAPTAEGAVVTDVGVAP